MSATPSLGLALGGGTARGLAHVGVLQVLEEYDLAPQAIAGTSYGAIIAALVALGVPAVEIERIVRQQNTGELWSQAIDFGLHQGALIHGRRLSQWLDRKLFHGATFGDCSIPLAIATTDLATGDLHILSNGPIARAVQASCALPYVFAPVEIDGRALVDGGLAEPVPFRTAAALGPQRLVGIHAGIDVDASRAVAWFRKLHETQVGRAWRRYAATLGTSNPWSRLAQGVSLSLRAYEHGIRVPEGALLVETRPPIAWWDFHRSPLAIAAGRQAMEAALNRNEHPLAESEGSVVPLEP